MNTDSKNRKNDKKKGYNPNNKKKFTPKYQEPEPKAADEVKAMFRGYFRKNSEAGHIMSKDNVIKHVLKQLKPKEDAAFAQALNELKSEGFIEVQEDGVSLLLTQKGSDSFS